MTTRHDPEPHLAETTPAPAPAPADRPEVLRYTAFSRDPQGGNPAGVVLDATGLTDAEQLAIAAELGYSETAFLTAPPPGLGGEPGRAFTVRFFSPLAEVPFCGHATVATAVALADRVGPGELLFATRAGTVPVAVTERDGVAYATLTSVEPKVSEVAAADLAEALAALGWAAADLDPRLPARIAYAGARHLVIGVATRERLADLDYDFDRLATFMRAHDLTTLQLAWATPGGTKRSATFHVRDPFPVGGVVEDPATGAAAAAFGAYTRALGITTAPATLTLHQGEDLGRPGLLEVRIAAGDPRIAVTGAATRIP
ncbi:PhzF family phenazine biosynthesis protein [Streptomyces buecherae]|uniref:PhzF family phenazine biosynthesis protein n=1 Tax=Streptomyces buecherae TaxID=2763006 RepID=UPI001C27F734|nr:PhzF family phenazine biosynthesis isomerase [Streptomyces buecherae]